MTDTGIKLHANITTVVQTYREQTQIIREAMARIADAEAKLGEIFSMDCHDVSVRDSRGRVNFDAPEDAMERVRRQVWRGLVEHLGLRGMMSISRAREMDEKLERGELPEITHESVADLVRNMTSALPEMLEEAVQEVYNFLRPPGSAYKTNSEFEVGRRVILPWCVEQWSTGAWHTCSDRASSRLSALENVFTALDGRGQIHKGHRSEIESAIMQSEGNGQTRYFEFRCFRNHNLHLKFLRPDLVKSLNQIAGGRRLRGARAA